MELFLTTHWGKVAASALVFAITIVAFFLEKVLYRAIHPRMQRREVLSALYGALHRPLQTAIWIIGISYAAEPWVHLFEGVRMREFFPPGRKALGLILIFWFFAALIREIEKHLLHKRGVDRMMVHAIGQVCRVVIGFCALVLILQMVFAVPVSGLVALAGGGGLTIGFAAKDLLTNFFGGMFLLLDRPFVHGDTIILVEKKIEGKVTHIGWRLTKIATGPKREIAIPNSVFLSALVETPVKAKKKQ